MIYEEMGHNKVLGSNPTATRIESFLDEVVIQQAELHLLTCVNSDCELMYVFQGGLLLIAYFYGGRGSSFFPYFRIISSVGY